MNAGRVVIVGGGIIGTLVAWFLKEQGYSGAVTVIERDPSYQFSSTARSAASIRTQFGCAVNVALSLFGVSFLRRVRDHLGVDAAIDFHEGGYLILGGRESADGRRKAFDMQKELGASVAMLDRGELANRYPWLALDDVAFATWGLSGEGWFDAWSLLRAARAAAIARGVVYIAEDASGIGVSGDRACDVLTAQGGRYAADWVVNAAGAQSGRVARWLGIDLPVGPRKRTVFHFKAPLDGRAMPMLFDTSGAWFRPEGDGFIGGIQPDRAVDVDAEGDFEPHHDLFEERFWPLIAARVPAFKQVRLRNAWAGHYEMNLFDHNGVVGPHPRITNLMFASGFSGHGVMHAPGVARGVAELIVAGRYQTLDLTSLHFQRILNGQPMLEDAIY